MKTFKGVKILIFILVVLLVSVLVGGYQYLKKEGQRETYFAKTTINGYDASELTPAQILSKIEDDYTSPKVTLREKEEDSITGSLADFGYELDLEAIGDRLEELKEEQTDSWMTVIEQLTGAHDYHVHIAYRFHPEVFAKKVNAAQLKEKRFPSEDAEMKFDKKKKEYYIQPEVYGNEFSDQALQLHVQNRIEQLISGDNPGVSITLDFPEELYIKPHVTSNDVELNSLTNIYNQYCKAKITYVFGSKEEVVDWDQIKEWLIVDNGSAYLSEERMYEFVIDLASRYNTRYYDRTFVTSIGTEVFFPGVMNTYGYTVNEDAEYQQLLEDIYANKETRREPVYFDMTFDGYDTPVYFERDGYDDLAGNYVEVNLTMQHLWFYRNGGLVVESDFVSGDVSKNLETHTGVFPLAFKESPSTLRGEDGPNGYRVEVQYWMPFSDGQGLHDASWRGAFGGNINQYNGSHGCINLPPYAAAEIYAYIEAGMAIIVYK